LPVVPEAISNLKFEISKPHRWYRLISGLGPPAWNMALDEALLQAIVSLGQPLLRFYGWREPAATFGYFQRYAEVARLTALRPLIRRPTGGGLVPHDADWTYSLMFPPGHEWYALRAVESYQRLHEWIQASLAKLGMTSELSPSCRKDPLGQCFAGAEQFDLLWQGRKIAGAAQRRARHGLLIQGSIQPRPASVSQEDWQNAFCEIAQHVWGVEWVALPPETVWTEPAGHLAQEKYAQKAYNERR
jgi:lipoate-protein ligase A